MALYELVCDKCEHTQSRLAPMSKLSELYGNCKCGGKLRQRYSPAHIFMGRLSLELHRKFSLPNKSINQEKADRKPSYFFSEGGL